MPRIEPEASKTKNRKGQAIPLHPDALAALQRLRELCPVGESLVFWKGITKMERFRKDLQEARIPELDARGRQLDFHAFRRTFATMLNGAGVSPRSAMELMRHSDMKLTFRTYTDAQLLPLSTELQKLPSLKSSPRSSPKTGKTCPELGKAGKSTSSDTSLEAAQEEKSGVVLTHSDQGCPTLENTEGVGFEPTGPGCFEHAPGIGGSLCWCRRFSAEAEASATPFFFPEGSEILLGSFPDTWDEQIRPEKSTS